MAFHLPFGLLQAFLVFLHQVQVPEQLVILQPGVVTVFAVDTCLDEDIDSDWNQKGSDFVVSRQVQVELYPDIFGFHDAMPHANQKRVEP